MGIDVIFPPITHFQYILNILEDLGYYINSENGILPLTYQEINSFLQATNIKLNRLEITTLKQLSLSYVNTYYSSKDETFEQPYILDKI